MYKEYEPRLIIDIALSNKHQKAQLYAHRDIKTVSLFSS